MVINAHCWHEVIRMKVYVLADRHLCALQYAKEIRTKVGDY